MENHRILEAVMSAIECVKSETRPLQAGVSERAIAHRLAVYMESQFEGWDIDCEYNRQGMLTKELQDIKGCDAQKKSNIIFPDIIVHHRTNNDEPSPDDNLLVIELKNNNDEDVCDRIKLELLTNPGGYYQYQLGLYINIGNHEFTRTWYKDGAQITEDQLGV